MFHLCCSREQGWRQHVVWVGLLVSAMFLACAEAHGRLIEPPSRATMWRYGFDTPPNYNDHELYCGGFSRQWNKNGGKCGICGDAWDQPEPRPHEAGGKYGLGHLVRRYKKNSAITVRVELTANHRGYFEFRLCPNNNPKRVATQTCLDQYVLERADKQGQQYYPGEGSRVFEVKYRLPSDLTCSQCVFQWRYIAGNNWGMCSNGTGKVGCGPQEEFRACADVTIVDEEGLSDDTEFVDDTINEIPDELPGSKEKTEEEEEEAEILFFVSFIIAGCTLAFAAVLLLIVYLYYYHGKSALKRLLHRSLDNRENTQAGPVPPLRVKRLSPMPLHTSANSISSPTSVTVNGIAIAP